MISLDEIGRMIRDKREADGLTRWDIADRAGVGETTVAYIERGERNVGWLTLQYVLVAAGLRLTCSVDGDNRSDP